MRKLAVECLWNANQAFRKLCEIGPDEVELVIIDVMLAVEDVDDEQFSFERTYEYRETGLCLLDDLAVQNPEVFPRRAVLLTNTINEKTFREAKKTSKRHDVPLWEKSRISSPVKFGDLVLDQIGALA